MSGTVTELCVMLENMLRTADRERLHPIDWQRFYDVIVYAAREELGEAFSADDLGRLLQDFSLSRGQVEQMQLVFAHGRRLLQYYRSLN